MLTMMTAPACAPDPLLDTVRNGSSDVEDPFGVPALAKPPRMAYQMRSPVLVCTECGGKIADAGRACPHCARTRVEMMQNVPVLFTALVAVAFLARVFVMFLS